MEVNICIFVWHKHSLIVFFGSTSYSICFVKYLALVSYDLSINAKMVTVYHWDEQMQQMLNECVWLFDSEQDIAFSSSKCSKKFSK